ncbi:hypothetical protein BJ878DRAFT_281151 [Calycina marina]|uniref:Uncharacterized protein n=1 Tax=Calycina marina TaxID=1763456 RepID=A0A9P7Z720_9HELO|nr:hypothetical protein BJ878DRAFT_281151 [Calycina marina]
MLQLQRYAKCSIPIYITSSSSGTVFLHPLIYDLVIVSGSRGRIRSFDHIFPVRPKNQFLVLTIVSTFLSHLSLFNYHVYLLKWLAISILLPIQKQYSIY